MTKTIVPIVVGAILGVLLIVVLSGIDRTDDQVSAVPTVPEAVPLPETRAPASLSEPDPANTDIAVSQLLAITDPAGRRDAALGLLDMLGYESENIDEISSALPLFEAVAFRIDAVVELGKQDTQGAIAAALSLAEPEQRRLALRRLARTLAERDPFGAVARIAAIDAPALGSEFMVALLDRWAMIDPDSALAYLDGRAEMPIPRAELAFDLLAARDPERLLDIADRFAPDVKTDAVTAALESIIRRDPLAALPRIGELAPGPDRSTLEREVARVYGEQDPEAAWRWANESDATADTRVLVLIGIQSVDPDRALDLVMAELSSADAGRRAEMRQRIDSYLYSLRGSTTSDDIVFALDQILALDSSVESKVQQFIGSWSYDDPEAALEWSLQNLDRIEPVQVLTSLGSNLARIDTQRARQTLFQLPEDYRVPWVTGVASALAEDDLAQARAWAFEFPSGSLRDAALREYVRSEAHGGSVDFQLFDQFSDDVARGLAASQVAYGLACDGHTALATEIVTTQIADSELLARSERTIEQNARNGPNSVGCVIGR